MDFRKVRDVTNIRVLAHFEFKIHKDFKIISRFYVLNCLKYFSIYILGQNVPKKINKKNFEHIKSSCIIFCAKMTRYSQRILNYSKSLSQNFPILSNCILLMYSISFLSSSDMQTYHHLQGCQATSINFSFNSFLSALRFSNLICQAKSLI